MIVHCPQCGEGFTVRPPILKVYFNSKGFLAAEFGGVVVDHLCEQKPQDR